MGSYRPEPRLTPGDVRELKQLANKLVDTATDMRLDRNAQIGNLMKVQEQLMALTNWFIARGSM